MTTHTRRPRLVIATEDSAKKRKRLKRLYRTLIRQIKIRRWANIYIARFYFDFFRPELR